MARYAYHRLDANHQEIREAYEAVGATVESCGPLDLVVGYQGRTFLVEVKTRKGKTRSAKQARFLAKWKGQAAIVRSPEEALQVIGASK
ncbi:MAG TPA: hypothetical protein VF491_17635 [Vicinamibacterales bacterium]